MFLADSPFRYKTFRRKEDARAFPGQVDFGLKGGFKLPQRPQCRAADRDAPRSHCAAVLRAAGFRRSSHAVSLRGDRHPKGRAAW